MAGHGAGHAGATTAPAEPTTAGADPGSTTSSMHIGALAAGAGVTADAIRYYERVGVLPRPRRGAAGCAHAGYRRYGPADLQRLAFVRRARALGFTLDEVRDLLSFADDPGRPCAEVDRLARAHLAQVEAKLVHLRALRAELARVVGDCRGGRAVADCRILGALGAPTTPAADRRTVG